MRTNWTRVETIEFLAGTDINTAAMEAHSRACEIKGYVEYDFNGVALRASEYTTPKANIDQYYAAIEAGRLEAGRLAKEEQTDLEALVTAVINSLPSDSWMEDKTFINVDAVREIRRRLNLTGSEDKAATPHAQQSQNASTK
jgi:hypothetical protein